VTRRIAANIAKLPAVLHNTRPRQNPHNAQPELLAIAACCLSFRVGLPLLWWNSPKRRFWVRLDKEHSLWGLIDGIGLRPQRRGLQTV
jgi:hypothetical protein